MFDITAIGEALIDLTQTGLSASGVAEYAANPGGAPANLAVAAAKLGASAAFIGRVGADAFGTQLRECLRANGVDVSRMLTDAQHPTTLAVVSLDARGERSFSFYRQHSADLALSPDDVPDDALRSTHFFHFGGVSLTANPARYGTGCCPARAKSRRVRHLRPKLPPGALGQPRGSHRRAEASPIAGGHFEGVGRRNGAADWNGQFAGRFGSTGGQWDFARAGDARREGRFLPFPGRNGYRRWRTVRCCGYKRCGRHVLRCVFEPNAGIHAG